jgi:hypothetical protein
MNKVMRNEKVIAMIIAIMALLTSFAIPVTSVEAKGPEMTSVWPSKPPVIDGSASAEEWGDAASINLTHGWMLVQNDASNLYLLIDLTGDIQEDSPWKEKPWGDYFELSFDVDISGDITYVPIPLETSDAMYALCPDTYPGPYDLCRWFYTGPENWTAGEAYTISQVGVGFGSSLNSQTDHRIWELAISLQEIAAFPAEMVRLGLRTHSPDDFTDDYPEWHFGNFSNLLEITLATPRVELLVLAHEDFCPALEPLKDHKEYTGMSTYIQSWQSLDKSFVGRDAPEKVKKGIYAYEMYCDTEYVMLVGDIDKFPARYTWWGRPDDEGWHVTDLYYADLREHGVQDFENWEDHFENWDYNNNLLYGEIEWDGDGTINNDHIDFLPEVAVGRIPASTVSEVTAYVNKVIAYEWDNPPSDTWFKTAGLYSGSSESSDNAEIDEIGNSLTNQNFNLIKRYWTSGQYPPGIPGVIIDDMNTGVGFAYHYGHGNRDCWPSLSLCSETLWGLTNSGRLPIVFAAVCDTGGFAPIPPYNPYLDVNGLEHCGRENGEVFDPYVDLPKPAPLQLGGISCNGTDLEFDPSCLAETFIFGHPMSSTGSGAIAYLGGRSAMQHLSMDLASYFFEAYDTGNCRVLGDMWKYMIEEYYTEHNLADSHNWEVDGSDWWTGCIFDQPRNLILFGDPSLRVGGVGGYFEFPCVCFVAAAAYGTPMAEEIEILREFRDEYLLTNPLGQILTNLYYRVSPPLAEFITGHPSLKPIVRAGLLPAVAMSAVAVNTIPAGRWP